MARSYKKNIVSKHRTGKKGGGLSEIIVRRRPGADTQGVLKAGAATFLCALGRSGISALKREGDGATPLGAMRIVRAYFPDQGSIRAGPLRLSRRRTHALLGWCDAPEDRNYNRPVRTPYRASHETMLRNDHLYDACIVLDWNFVRRRRGAGSAIFLHLARPGLQPTEGCVAVAPGAMRRLLPLLTARTVLRVIR